MNKYLKHLMITILILFCFIFAVSNISYAQLSWSIEFDVCYDAIIPNSKILYNANEYSFTSYFLYFPVGVTLSFTTSKFVSFAVDLFYEYRFFTRNTTYQTKSEKFSFGFHLLQLPISMRIHLPLNMFITVGFQMNFVVGSHFEGDMLHYLSEPTNITNDNEIPDPKIEEVEVIDSGSVIFQNVVHNTDYSFTIGFGWKYNFTEKLFLVVQARGAFSIKDIDKSLYYRTYLYSIIAIASFGINL
jgi:hypothetical protein